MHQNSPSTHLKNHFISILSTVDSHYPLAKRGHFIPHAVMTLNLLRSSHIHTSLSAFACLLEAAILACEQLHAHLSQFGYVPFKNTPGMWHHTTQPIMFATAVDDFCIKYFYNANIEHLISALRKNTPLMCDWTGYTYLELANNHNPLKAQQKHV